MPTGEADVDATITTGEAPPAEVEVDEALVARLLAAQHPDLADRPLRAAAEGWDNVTFRLGEDLAVRLPRRAAGVPLLEHEQRWLPELADQVGVAVPRPVRVGRPAAGYPFPWSVVTWVPGTVTADAPLRAEGAGDLGAFLRRLHRPAPADAPRNPHRGVALAVKSPGIGPRLDRLVATGELAAGVAADLARRWAAAVAVPVDVGPTWFHGDLHPKNVVGRDGRLVGVLDWGDLGVGDRATDLAAVWLHLEPDDHAAAWEAYGPVSAATRSRAEGWALFFGVVLTDTAADATDPFGRIGRATLDRLLG